MKFLKKLEIICVCTYIHTYYMHEDRERENSSMESFQVLCEHPHLLVRM